MRDAEILAALFRTPKAKKARAPRKPAIKVGAIVHVFGKPVKVIGRDARYATAWFVEGECGRQASVSRDMIEVI